MNNSQINYRHRWLSETISNLFGIADRKFADALITEHNDKINKFFNDEINEFADYNERLLFIWRTFYDKLVEETITVLDAGK